MSQWNAFQCELNFIFNKILKKNDKQINNKPRETIIDVWTPSTQKSHAISTRRQITVLMIDSGKQRFNAIYTIS